MGKKSQVVDNGSPTITQDPMTEFVQKRRNYTDKEIMAYSRSMAEAIVAIDGIEIEKKAFADAKKDEIEGQETIVHDCAVRINQGYEMIPVECKVTYDGNIAIYTEKSTGEFVDKRELTKEEQMRLSDKWVDAEQVIRDSNKEE